MIDLSELVLEPLTARAKGIPSALEGVRLRDAPPMVGTILNSAMPSAVAVVRETALRRNIDLMMRYTRSLGAELAPHGKTTMSPQLFKHQLDAGAWGMTCATPAHLRTYLHHGVGRIIMANQLWDRDVADLIAERLQADPEFEFLALVDSVEGILFYADAMRRSGGARRIRLLLEVGVEDGRTGIRGLDSVLAVARHIKQNDDRLSLAGFAAFEGIFRGTPADNEGHVRNLAKRLVEFAVHCDELELIDGDEIILSAGGSGYFDIVADVLARAQLSRPTRLVLRSGCYVTHDHGFYAAAVDRLVERTKSGPFTEQAFEPALEIWAEVQSCPEPGLAFLSFGKRDVSHDLGLPKPLKLWRTGMVEPKVIGGDAEIVGLNDHHAYLRFDEGLAIAIGDRIGVGISHPCTTFDRWQYLYLVDDSYGVLDILKTCF